MDFHVVIQPLRPSPDSIGQVAISTEAIAAKATIGIAEVLYGRLPSSQVVDDGRSPSPLPRRINQALGMHAFKPESVMPVTYRV